MANQKCWCWYGATPRNKNLSYPTFFFLFFIHMHIRVQFSCLFFLVQSFVRSTTSTSFCVLQSPLTLCSYDLKREIWKFCGAHLSKKWKMHSRSLEWASKVLWLRTDAFLHFWRGKVSHASNDAVSCLERFQLHSRVLEIDHVSIRLGMGNLRNFIKIE